jgi:hypothetical protein
MSSGSRRRRRRRRRKKKKKKKKREEGGGGGGGEKRREGGGEKKEEEKKEEEEKKKKKGSPIMEPSLKVPFMESLAEGCPPSFTYQSPRCMSPIHYSIRSVQNPADQQIHRTERTKIITENRQWIHSEIWSLK